jgi:hypothetical protein
MENYTQKLKSLNVQVSLIGLLIIFSSQYVLKAEPIHPRAFLKPDQIPALRTKVNKAPFRDMYLNIRETTLRQQEEQNHREYEPYADSRLLGNQAYLYLLTGEKSWANNAWVSAQRILRDSTFFYNTQAKGLTRALLLQKMAVAYDLCFTAWNDIQRKAVNDVLYDMMFSINATMGHSANYSIESNWMGVRFGTVILASYIWDDTTSVKNGQKNPALALRWDASKRLQEHLEKTLFNNGWNGESMSYHMYGWTFVGPALLAMKNNITNFELADFAPEAVHTLQGIMTSTVAIEHKGIKGMQADLSDDDLTFSTSGVLGMSFALYPEEQRAALKWMHHYLIDPANYQMHEDGHLIYSLLFYPENTEAKNPAEIGWLTYHDPEQGIVISRNRFQDENDIVSTYNAKATRIRGHAGPDANTFRLIGEGVPWIIGGGRTGLTAGQSNLFPAIEATAERDSKGLGTLHDYQFMEDASDAYAIGSGSSVGTQNHQRIHYTSFSDETGASAVVVVKEQSANGKRWRINTPEFNQLTETKNGFLLTAPNGASMQVQFLEPQGPLRIESGKVRYGGETEQHNSGIWYRGEAYTHSRYIDVYCQGKVNAVISVQPVGKAHPQATRLPSEKIRVGEKEVALPGFEAVIGKR